jgi:hypothetical protein
MAAALLDLCGGRRVESTFAKLFGTELYSNRAVLAATRWRPRTQLQDVAAELMATAGSPG